MGDKLFKQVERAIARYFGGKRNPVHGSGPKADVSTPTLSIEVKERASLPNWLIKAIVQSEANCEEGKLPIVVLHRKYDDHDKDLVIIRAKDFRDWYV